MKDNRKSARRRTLKSGRVIFNNGKSVLDCLIRDISLTGAKLRFGAPVILPGTGLELLIVGSDQRRPIEVAWQRGDEAGVAFLPGPA